jgi:hypothetical protein
MEKIAIIMTWNFIIVLIFSVSSFLMSNDDGIGFAILFVPIQIVINFILSFYNFYIGKKELGKSFFLSALLLLIIGPSTCFGAFIFLDQF